MCAETTTHVDVLEINYLSFWPIRSKDLIELWHMAEAVYSRIYESHCASRRLSDFFCVCHLCPNLSVSQSASSRPSMCESEQWSAAGENVKSLLPLQETSSWPCLIPQKAPKPQVSKWSI